MVGCRSSGWLLQVLLWLAALACSQARSASPGEAVEAQWTGADTGSMRGRATARWCPDGKFGELLGLEGDTGIAIAFRRMESLAPGRYTAVVPDSADTASASATVALRFLARTAVSGYQSDSGSVTLERDSAGRIGARFQVRARVVGGAGRITLRGAMAPMQVVRGGAECAVPWRPSE